MSTDQLREEVRRLCSLVEGLKMLPCKFDCRKGVLDTWIQGYIESQRNAARGSILGAHDAWTEWNENKEKD